MCQVLIVSGEGKILKVNKIHVTFEFVEEINIKILK